MGTPPEKDREGAAGERPAGRDRRQGRLKPLGEQVVVVLGASAGIGREVALQAARRGAAVVVAARGAAGLATLVQQVEAAGGRALPVVCDVAEADQVQAVATAAVERFGRIDTWVNVAATSVFATFEETTPQEFRRVMEVNYLGQVHGALAALPYLRREGRGALIFLSSVESRVSLPRHAAYSASKQAVEGMVDSLRRDLQADGAPVSVTSIKPGTINTPFFDNALNKMDVQPQGPPPWYQPSVVADCVLYAAEHPVRDLYAGGAAKQMVLTQSFAPWLVDAVLGRFADRLVRTGTPAPGGSRGAFDAPRDDDRTEGDFSDRARRTSLYTWWQTHPALRPVAAGGLLATVLVRRARR